MADVPVVTEAPAAPALAAPAPPLAEPAPAPWTKDLQERFTDPAVYAEVDKYMREKQQPYVTGLEQARKEAADKAAIYDDLNEGFNTDPAAMLRDIAAQYYDADVADRIVELVAGGKTPEAAEKQAVAEDKAVELPEDVRETVEWAKQERAARQEATELAEAQKALDEWKTATLAAHPHVNELKLLRRVGATGDMEQALAWYLEEYPAPTADAPNVPATLGGKSSPRGPDAPKLSLREAAGAVFEAAAGRRD